MIIRCIQKKLISSNDDKRLQTYDKTTTYPYGTPAIKVCESEMLSKNKLSRPDEYKNTSKDRDKDKTTPKTMTKTEDKDKDKNKTTPKNIVKTEDKDKIIPKTKTKTKTKDKDKNKTIPKTKTKTKTEDKDEDIDMDENRPIQMFQYARLMRNRKNGS